MASAIFIVPLVAGGPSLDLHRLITEDPREIYGYSVVGQIPSANTCLVRVWSSDTILDQLALDPDLLFVEDVTEEGINGN